MHKTIESLLSIERSRPEAHASDMLAYRKRSEGRGDAVGCGVKPHHIKRKQNSEAYFAINIGPCKAKQK
jgi:hypothetical protein